MDTSLLLAITPPYEEFLDGQMLLREFSDFVALVEQGDTALALSELERVFMICCNMFTGAEIEDMQIHDKLEPEMLEAYIMLMRDQEIQLVRKLRAKAEVFAKTLQGDQRANKHEVISLLLVMAINIPEDLNLLYAREKVAYSDKLKTTPK